MPERIAMPEAFAKAVSDGIESILAHQQPDGSIIYDPKAPIVYPQQAIMPLAFCYAGLGTNPEHKKSKKLETAMRKLGDFLVSKFDDRGHFVFDSWGYKVDGVDQRLTYAWTEGLRIAREAGADIPFDKWGDKILRACQTLQRHRMDKLIGVRRFISRVLGTSTNHVSLYVTTVYRAGEVLKRRDLCDYALPIGRALAADIHPDGYFEEHGDLLRLGGPTPSYNYLTHSAMALMYEWTGEAVFMQSVERSTNFHNNFCYPDASFLDLIDERVRYNTTGRIWGLFGFSHSATGRGSAVRHMESWLADTGKDPDKSPEALARHVENFLYWHKGPVAPAAFENPEHRAALMLPAAVCRKSKWFLAVSAIAATNAEDAAYRGNPFALDRQKLFSVWHEKTGLLIDGSHSKNQREYSTFAARADYADDYYPAGGCVGEERGEVVARAAYKTFFGEVRLRELSPTTLQIELSADPAGNRGPFIAGFTLRKIVDRIRGANGREEALGENEFTHTGADLGGAFHYGAAKIAGPAEMTVRWPLSPFNSYSATGKSSPAASQVRVEMELTMQKPRAVFTVTIE